VPGFYQVVACSMLFGGLLVVICPVSSLYDCNMAIFSCILPYMSVLLNLIHLLGK
jgi:hypothetical protein